MNGRLKWAWLFPKGSACRKCTVARLGKFWEYTVKAGKYIKLAETAMGKLGKGVLNPN